MRVNGRITTISLVENATHHFKSRSNYITSSQRLIPIVLQSTLFYPPVFTSMRCQRMSNHLYFQTTPEDDSIKRDYFSHFKRQFTFV